MPRSNPPLTRALQLAVLLSAAALTTTALTGCGSTTKVQNQESVGQQLMDLEKSFKDGIINQKEYERLKKRIIREND